MANPITTASNPRVGEDVGRELISVRRSLLIEAVEALIDYTQETTGQLQSRLRDALASAPSPEAGAGGDLGGEPSGTGSREPGPMVPALSGVDPSRVDRIWDDETRNILEAEADQKIEATARTLPFEINKHFWTIKAHVTGIFDHSEDPHVRDDAAAIKSSLADLADALALGTEARSAETFGLGPKDDGPACKATPDLLAHLLTENANLRDRVREAEEAGRDPDGSGSRPSDQAASHPAPAGFDPSRGPAGMRRVTIKRYDAETGHFPWVDTWALEDRLQEARDKGFWCGSSCDAGGQLPGCSWPLCGCDPYANALAALGIEAAVPPEPKGPAEGESPARRAMPNPLSPEPQEAGDGR